MKVSHTSSRTQGSAIHNDRSFDVTKAPHINSEKGENTYWRYWDGMKLSEQEKERFAGKSFRELEEMFYSDRYKNLLDRFNEGKKEQASIRNFMKIHRYRPEEVILQIGNVPEPLRDPVLFDECFHDYMKQLNEWNEAHGDHMHILDYAIHRDEENIHAHIRRVWDYEGADGKLHISPELALKAAGIAAPDPGKEISRANIRKKGFDAMMRERWINICEARGIDVDRVPVPDRHKTVHEHKRDKTVEQIERSSARIRIMEKALREADLNIPESIKEIDTEGNWTGNILLEPKEYHKLERDSEKAVETRRMAEERRENAEAERMTVEEKCSRRRFVRAEMDDYVQKTQAIRELLDRQGSGFYQSVMKAGVAAIESLRQEELEYFDKGGLSYNPERFDSIDEAMDAMERDLSGGFIVEEQEK